MKPSLASELSCKPVIESKTSAFWKLMLLYLARTSHFRPHFRQKVGDKAIFGLDITVPQAEVEPLC